RAGEARSDLQAAIDATISQLSLVVRRGAEVTQRLQAARDASYPVEGRPPGGDEASAELFGSTAQGEVSEARVFEHLTATLHTQREGQPEPLREKHVTGTDIPPDVEAEVEPDVEAFRSGRRGERTLSRRERLETIYRTLRRALIVLNPPPAPPP